MTQDRFETSGRPSVEERAARRRRVERSGNDRYGSLLRLLRAGQQVPLEEPVRATVNWHPIFWKLVRLALVGVLLYAGVSVGYRLWRQNHVDVWSGPDTSVASGQRLDGCPIVNVLYDDSYPTWVRYGGSVYRMTDLSRPFGSNKDGAYVPSGYSLGSLELFRITDTPDGRAGRTVLLKFSGSIVGELFLMTPDCS